MKVTSGNAVIIMTDTLLHGEGPMKQQGFTLIELMIVIALIAVVSALAIPNLIAARKASNEAAAIASVKSIASAQAIFRANDKDGDGK